MSGEIENPDGEQTGGIAYCAPGEYATGGGVVTDSDTPGEQSVNSSVAAFSDPDDPSILAPDAWIAFVDNTAASGTNDPSLTFTVVVTCAPAEDVGVYGKKKLLGMKALDER